MTETERFQSQIGPPRTDGCRVWAGATNGDGYGIFYATGKKWRAHRFAFESAHGPLPVGSVVRHRCDRRVCVNPDHLLAGAQADNIRDRDERGRQARGESHACSILTEPEVLTIRGAWNSGVVTQKALAAAFGVAAYTVGQVVRRESWRHI